MPKDMKKKGFMECLSNFMRDSEGLTQEDLSAELKEQGIDEERLGAEVAELTECGSEEWRLGWRKHARQRAEEIKKFLDLTRTLPDAAVDLKDRISGFIKNTYGQRAFGHAEAYFRNKSTLSEKDLIGLFEDLEQLESLEKSHSAENG